ncbi:uncharacterized protein (TIGR04141 family) [Saccharopolyspora spinosa]|uniref:Uncharacterized protein (TIGR04141 family) n=2 Tax=Saccharopolyspora spinosa TaxID=60894 RepID=A0A2N3XW03_SACSN|nr:uncharacterized protein (TIGR04141 family) [Saccharopolyspora spinosa]
MARPPSRASKTSLYRLQIAPDEQLTAGAKTDYLDRNEFHQQTVEVGARPALLVYGQIPKAQPDWLDHAQSLTRFRPPCSNDTSAGLLILRLADDSRFCYGLSWGMGHLVVSSERIDDGFGLRFALRRADSNQISALTTHALDSLPRTARLSIFGGTAINSFGMEDIGEVVSRIVGKIPATGLSSSRANVEAFITVRGADALSVPIGRTPDDALHDLAMIDHVIRNEEPAEGLEYLENTRPLRPGHPRIEPLEHALAEELAGEAPSRVALCWPAGWNEDLGEVETFRITGLGSENTEIPDIELDDILEPLARCEEADKFARLRRMDIQGLAAGGSPMSRKISADKWITFECDMDGERYVLQRGRWYNVGGAYIDMLEDKVARALGNKSELVLPAWPLQWKKKKNGEDCLGRANEREYNQWVAREQTELLCMDRKLIPAEVHPGGFEACDLLHTDGTLIHVKHLDDSTSASHLFNQALVSVEALSRQVDARDNFIRKAAEISEGTHELPVDFRPATVVLAFSGGGAIADSIFTFSKIALVRCFQRLSDFGVTLKVARLTESDDVLEAGA